MSVPRAGAWGRGIMTFCDPLLLRLAWACYKHFCSNTGTCCIEPKCKPKPKLEALSVRRIVEQSLELYTCSAGGTDSEMPAEARNGTMLENLNLVCAQAHRGAVAGAVHVQRGRRGQRDAGGGAQRHDAALLQ